MKRPQTWVVTGVVTVVVIGVAVFVLPMFSRSYTPGWAEDSGHFLKTMGGALKQYADKNDGALPPTLVDLYPEYTKDERVSDPVIRFGKVRMAVAYYRPDRLGDAQTAVAELRLDPAQKTDYRWRGFVLWGNMQVSLSK